MFSSFLMHFFHFPGFFSIPGIVTLRSSLSISEGVGLVSESYLPDIQSSEKKHFEKERKKQTN